MRLKTYVDIDSQRLQFGPVTNHGDFPFRLFLKVEFNDGDYEGLGKYIITIGCVSPDAGESQAKNVRDCIGLSEDEWRKVDHAYKCQAYVDYGCYATFGQWNGNNLRNLLRLARKELQTADFLFGFYMDKPQNAIGATGWDTIKGELWPAK